MKKKIIVSALSLLLLFTFYVQQNTYAAIDTDRETYCTITFSSGYQYDLWMTKRDSHECLGNFETVLFVYPSIDNSTVYAIARYFISSVPDSSSSTIFSWKSNFGSWGSDWSGQSLVMEPELSQNDIKDGQVISLTMSQITRKEGNPEPIIDGYDYLVECDSFDDFTKKREQLTNNDVNFDDIGVTGTTWTENGAEYLKVKYDLPSPKGVSVSHKDATFEQNTYMDETTTGDYFINWAIDEDLAKKSYINDLMLKADIKCFGKTRFSIVNDWKDWETDFFPLTETPALNQRYKFNQTDDSIQSYYHEFEKESQDWNISIGPVFGQDTANQNFRLKNPNVLLTYHYTDEKNGVEHYSKKSVLVVVHDDSYQTYEVDTEKDIIDSDYGNKEINSNNIIKDENLIDDNYIEEVTSDNSSSSFIGKVKNFMNEIGNVPRYFARIFSFLPDWCIEFIAFGFTIIVAVGVLKAIF